MESSACREDLWNEGEGAPKGNRPQKHPSSIQVVIQTRTRPPQHFWPCTPLPPGLVKTPDKPGSLSEPFTFQQTGLAPYKPDPHLSFSGQASRTGDRKSPCSQGTLVSRA